ncbi:MAG: hypothetical protein ABR576_00140 [Thermoanaerobaculia bacterium]
MKRSAPARPRKPHQGRTESDPRSVRIDLKPGEVLVTSSVILIARQIGGGLGVTTSVTCRCTKAEPNKPDCQPKTTKIPGGVNVDCIKSGGCEKCDQTTTTKGVMMF